MFKFLLFFSGILYFSFFNPAPECVNRLINELNTAENLDIRKLT